MMERQRQLHRLNEGNCSVSLHISCMAISLFLGVTFVLNVTEHSKMEMYLYYESNESMPQFATRLWSEC